MPQSVNDLMFGLAAGRTTGERGSQNLSNWTFIV